MRPARRTGLALAAVIAAFTLPAQAAALLAPHGAVYDLSLDGATDDSDITGAAGRIVYEFDGSACDGYTTKFRMVTQLDTEEASRLSDLQTSSFEDGDGKSFSFISKSYIDQNLDKEVKGVATRGRTETTVQIDKPKPRTVALEATQFPTQHTLEMIEKAKEGVRFYQTTLFDASEDADKATMTTVVIGDERKTAADDPERAAMGKLADDSYWPVQIAYYDLSDGDGDETPNYRISFKLHANGITRGLAMDYGDFSMTGRLVRLDLFDHAAEGCGH